MNPVENSPDPMGLSGGNQPDPVGTCRIRWEFAGSGELAGSGRKLAGSSGNLPDPIGISIGT